MSATRENRGYRPARFRPGSGSGFAAFRPPPPRGGGGGAPPPTLEVTLTGRDLDASFANLVTRQEF